MKISKSIFWICMIIIVPTITLILLYITIGYIQDRDGESAKIVDDKEFYEIRSSCNNLQDCYNYLLINLEMNYGKEVLANSPVLFTQEDVIRTIKCQDSACYTSLAYQHPTQSIILRVLGLDEEEDDTENPTAIIN